MKFSTLAAAVACLISSAAAQPQTPSDSDSAHTNYGLYLPVGDDQEVTLLSGNLLIPPWTGQNLKYIWPGVEPSSAPANVIQAVLDGSKTSHWQMGSGVFGPNLGQPWGSQIDITPGDSVFFNLSNFGKTWSTYVQEVGHSGNSAEKWLTIGDFTINQVYFDVEFYGAPWDFGPVTFSDIKIQTNGTATDWCKTQMTFPGNGSPVTYTVSNADATVDAGGVTCSMNTLVLQGPS